MEQKIAATTRSPSPLRKGPATFRRGPGGFGGLKPATLRVRRALRPQDPRATPLMGRRLGPIIAG